MEYIIHNPETSHLLLAVVKSGRAKERIEDIKKNYGVIYNPKVRDKFRCNNCRAVISGGATTCPSCDHPNDPVLG